MAFHKPRSHKTQKSHLPPVSEETRKILEYWRSCLLDSERMGISAKILATQGRDISLEGAQLGQCSRKVADELYEIARETGRTSRSRNSDSSGDAFSGRADSLPVLLCPLRYVWKSETRAEELGMHRYLELLWMPATLKKDGALLPRASCPAWIPREFLEPTSSDESITIGSADDIEVFYRHNPLPEKISWSQYWEWCERFIKSVTGAAPSKFELSDYERRKTSIVVLENSSSGANRQALRVYNQILDRVRPPGLLIELASLREKADRSPIYLRNTETSLRRGAHKHLGQVGDSFPLAPSQRKAVHQSLLTQSGQILTVTGPPGTGKTTLLQSVIASLWIQSAVQKNAVPPVILACAGTNQAVTNIVEAFSKSAGRSDNSSELLSERWLPGLKSYGCYCPSESKLETANLDVIHFERTTGDGLEQEMLNDEYVRLATELFLEKFQQFSGRKSNLNKAVRILQGLVEAEVHEISKRVGRVGVWASIQEKFSRFVAQDTENYKQLLEELETLDVTHRFSAFRFATHYWEGRWLQEANAVLRNRKSKDNQKRRADVEPEDWARRAMITPCFVSTFAMGPRFFGRLTAEGTASIDLLIVDEASQILPDEGAAIFALAKKALVVGDTMQLEPVRSIPEFIDRENLKRAKLLRTDQDEEFAPLIRKGVTSSHGSLMELAQRACRVIDENAVGVFLSEHRRCVPGVIQFCNAWAYRNRLVPMRPPLTNPLFPSIGYAQISGSSEMVGPSRENIHEAKTIAEWIKQNQARIERHYEGQAMQDLVAVITPFAAQKRRLMRLLHKNFPRMTIGTVHGLQGAERRIVIFSPVYDRTTKTDYFFDRDDKMLNVAVSRAQDSFLVFGEMGLFDSRTLGVDGKPSPSAVLARLLFQSPENELRNVSFNPSPRGSNS